MLWSVHWRYARVSLHLFASLADSVDRRLQRNEMEDSWPLLLPPLLAYLDDHDASKKIVGTSILQTLLERVDSGLLVRTGVGKVFEQVREKTSKLQPLFHCFY